MKHELLLAAIVALSASGIASAQNPSKISSNFSTFAGSTENSDSLVTGLRSGGLLITLSSTDAAGVTTTTTFDTPTGKMGYGNVNKSLLLARQQLADVGITQPTNAQIQASLVGGEVTVPGQTTPTQLQGVLTMRAGGMGWGQISKTLGHNLGSVMSGRATTPVAAPLPAPAQLPATAATKASASGVTNASGASSTGVTTAAGSSNGQGNAYGRGITTGAGTSAGQGQGNAYGRGITTGAGTPPGQSGTASQGKGKGG